jgi:hypothetical protein
MEYQVEYSEGCLSQEWEKINYRINIALFLANKADSKTRNYQTVSKQFNCNPEQNSRIFIEMQHIKCPTGKIHNIRYLSPNF